ncbi:MAG: hypothetical protein LKE40_11875 [Spirochaetia bacterium]|nr:hypothetical protein [Spirochaetia bacterium]
MIFGFHGCDEDVRNQLVNRQIELSPSNNSYDWLGPGMYFWENNVHRAYEWADYTMKHPQNKNQSIKKPSVVGAVLCLGSCLDFLDAENLELLKPAYDFLCHQTEETGKPIPKNRGNGLIRNLDCAVIEMLISLKKEKEVVYDSVRGVFFEGEPIYENAGFRSRNHIQLCIRNPNCIKGYFIPRDLDEKYSCV